MNSSEKILKAICTVLLIIISLFANAQVTVWIHSGSGSASWHNASNWSQGVPNLLSLAIIPENNSNTYPVILPQSDVGVATAHVVLINEGAALTGQVGSSLQITPFGGSVGI